MKDKNKKIDFSFLFEVMEIISNRGKDYGDIKENHEAIAKGWEVILEKENIPPHKIALCMDWLKTVRLLTNPKHKDSIKDKVGYTITYNHCVDDAP